MLDIATILNTVAIIILALSVALLAKNQRKKYEPVRKEYESLRVRAGDKLSVLDRRRRALKIATKDWLKDIELGFFVSASEAKRNVEQLELEVSMLENEIFGEEK